MSDMDNFTRGIEASKEMVEQLGKAFIELKSHGESAFENKTQWEDIKEYFHKLENSLKRKVTKVEEMEREFEEKQSTVKKLIEEREAAVAAKEQALLDHLQDLKDSAVSAILEACKNCKVPTPVLVDDKGSKDTKVSIIDDPNAPIPASMQNLPDNKSGNPAEALAGEVKIGPQLKELCEKMDAKGLMKFLSGNRKNLANTTGEELSTALKCATEPARLVLDSLEGFYPPDSSNLQGSEDTGLQLFRRSCLVVMESAAPLLRMAGPNDHSLNSEIKHQAKAIADEWEAKLAGVDIDASSGYSLEVVAFLQLLATFSIVDEFDKDELCKLVFVSSRHRETPEICRSLGLAEKMPGLVENLVDSGRLIDAVHFARAFQLTERFPPVPLLKKHLEDTIERTVAVSGQTDFNKKELGALRVVIKCIEEYKLHEQYPAEPLKKRVAQLEKAKYDKKRMGQAADVQAKKPRPNKGHAFRKPSKPVNNRQLPPPIHNERGLYPGLAERYPETYPGLAERYPETYPYAVPHAYEVASHAPYGQQPNAQRLYHYPDERVAPPAPYSNPSNYGSYAGSGFQSSAPHNYENYMGSGVQSTSSYYGSYMGTGAQPPHQSSM